LDFLLTLSSVSEAFATSVVVLLISRALPGQFATLLVSRGQFASLLVSFAAAAF
jgi:hypothetical protein